MDPNTDPADEALERGVDEISSGPDDARGQGGNDCYLGSALVIVLRQLVALSLALAVGLLENRVTRLGRVGARPGFAFAHLAFEQVAAFLDAPAVFVEHDDLIGGQGIALENIREEPGVKLIINVLRWRNEILFSLTES